MKKITLKLFLFLTVYTPLLISNSFEESNEDDQEHSKQIIRIQRAYAQLRIAMNQQQLNQQNIKLSTWLQQATKLNDSKWIAILNEHLTMNHIQAGHFEEKSNGRIALNMITYQQELEARGLLEKLE